MNTQATFLLKMDALDVIKTFRVPDLQALLDFASVSRQGNKSELFQRCKILLSSSPTTQLLSKINQIHAARINTSRPASLHPPATRTCPAPQQSLVLPPTPSIDQLPLPQQIQFAHLPFFEKVRTIECANMPVDKTSFLPLRFVLTDFDVDLVHKGIAKIFLRLAPTVIHDKQNDVLPPYAFVQCNNQPVISNNVGKTVGAAAHSIVFPTDMTDKVIVKANVCNILNYFWLQLPVSMSFKSLPKSYTLSIQLVRCVPLETLCENILQRELQTARKPAHDPDIEDVGLMTTRHRVSLICPITQALIIVPTKSSYCSHLACFDLRSFLQMNQRRLQWTCPLCKKPASYETLHVDKRLKAILANVPANCSTVEIDTSTKNLSDCQYILDHGSAASDDDDDDAKPAVAQNTSIKSRCQSAASDCVILSSDDESDDDEHSTSRQSAPPTPFSTESVRPKSFNDVPHSNCTDPSLDDERYWQAIARFTNQLLPHNQHGEACSTRKRPSSSSSSQADSASARKRPKHSGSQRPSSSSEIEVITLSSSDGSDNDDQFP